MRHLIIGLLIALIGVLGTPPAFSNDPSLTPRYVLVTNLGEIQLELDATNAPTTVVNFDQYATSGFYNGTVFHRVIKDFMIQGGGFTAERAESADGAASYNYQQKRDGLQPGILNEWRNGLRNDRGTIAMARISRQPNSATAQFFINHADNEMLNVPNDGAAYAVFGKVVEGMDVVDAIANVETTRHAAFGNRERAVPVEPIVISEVRVLVPLDREAAEALRAPFATELERREKEAAEAARRAAMAEVEDYVAAKEKEFGATREITDSGLISIVVKPGTGTVKPTTRNQVDVHYTGTFLDGREFDSSRRPGRGPFTVSLSGGVIQGWLEGLRLMTEGEQRHFIIPPALAYGEMGMPPTIPPNSWLAFDVEMLKIK
jgi:cyclophilin family peptidyl-prolyl cis-trans isomerase